MYVYIMNTLKSLQDRFSAFVFISLQLSLRRFIQNGMAITKNFIKELQWRGMIHDVMPGTEEHLMENMRSAYVGIDPTADSLHIGHLVSVMMLKHFQLCGHKPIALVGGATGMIGDPSGKSAERNLLNETTLRHNQEAIQKQLNRFWILIQMLLTGQNL